MLVKPKKRKKKQYYMCKQYYGPKTYVLVSA